MSAYVVDLPTIDVIVRAGIGYGLVRPESASLVGQALLAANVASVTYRYADVVGGGSMPGPTSMPAPVTWNGADGARGSNGGFITPSPYTYTKRTEGEPLLDPARVLGCIECLNYQSCELPGWNESAAFTFLNALTRRIMRRHPGIERPESAWNVRTIAEAHAS